MYVSIHIRSFIPLSSYLAKHSSSLIMEMFQELLLTVFFSLFLSLFVAKLVSIASRETVDVSRSSEEGKKALRREKESERRVRPIEGDVREVDRFAGETSVDDDVALVCEEDIVEHSMAEEENFGGVGGDGGSFERLGVIGENVEKIGVDDVAVERRCEKVVLEESDDEEKIVEHLAVVDCAIVEYVGSDGDSFECSGAIGENTGKVGVEGENMVNLVGNNDQVVGISKEMIVEHLMVDDVVDEDVGGDGVSFESLGAIGENIEQIGVKDDIRGNIESSDFIVDEVAVEERSGGRKLEEFEEKIVEHVSVDNDDSESSRVNGDNIGSIGVEGDIMVNWGKSDPLEEKSDGSKLEGFKENIVEYLGVENPSSENSGANTECVENVGVGVDEDDDWEGIERSELEENFAAAANYVFYSDKNICEPKLDNNVKMELYGLNKVALEGPCREGQPMAIKVSARAKWHAWQKLGNMSPELAMEQYIALLSEKSPEWMESKSSGDGSKYSSMVSEASPPDIKESVSELNSATPTNGSISVNKI